MEEVKKPFLSYLLKEKKTPASIMPERKKQAENGPLRILTSLSAVLLMITIVMGMLLFNSVSTLDGIRNQLETMDLQMEEMHKTMAGVESTLIESAAPDQNSDAGQQGEE